MQHPHTKHRGSPRQKVSLAAPSLHIRVYTVYIIVALTGYVIAVARLSPASSPSAVSMPPSGSGGIVNSI